MNPLVTESAGRDMAETAEWAAANITRLGPISIETAADIASTRRALKLAADMHRAQRLDDNVGRFVGALAIVQRPLTSTAPMRARQALASS